MGVNTKLLQIHTIFNKNIITKEQNVTSMAVIYYP